MPTWTGGEPAAAGRRAARGRPGRAAARRWRSGCAGWCSGRWPGSAAEVRRVADGDFELRGRRHRPARARGARPRTWTRCAEQIVAELPTRCGDATEPAGPSRPRSWSGPTPSWSSSPTSPRTTCRSRCARWPASPSCWSAATRASWTSGPTSTSPSRWTAPSGCRLLINDLLAFSRVGRLTREHRRDRRRTSWSTQAAGQPVAGASRRPAPTVTVAGPALVSGRRGAAGRRVPEPDRQRDEVPRRGSRRGSASASDARRRVGVLGRRQRHRHRARVRRPDLRDLPAAARQGRLPRHRHRPGHVPQDRRIPRRADLARHRRRPTGPPFRFTLPELDRRADPSSKSRRPPHDGR